MKTQYDAILDMTATFREDGNRYTAILTDFHTRQTEKGMRLYLNAEIKDECGDKEEIIISLPQARCEYVKNQLIRQFGRGFKNFRECLEFALLHEFAITYEYSEQYGEQWNFKL